MVSFEGLCRIQVARIMQDEVCVPKLAFNCGSIRGQKIDDDNQVLPTPNDINILYNQVTEGRSHVHAVLASNSHIGGVYCHRWMVHKSQSRLVCVAVLGGYYSCSIGVSRPSGSKSHTICTFL